MIDAKGGYIKDGAKNRLREQDIRRIVDVWQAQRDEPHYARFVPMEELNVTITISTFLAMYLFPIQRFCKISMLTFMEVCPNTI